MKTWCFIYSLSRVYSTVNILFSCSFVSQVPGQPQNQPQPQPPAETSSSAPRTSDPPVSSTSAGAKTVGPLAVAPASAGTTSVNVDKPPVAVAPAAVAGAATAGAAAASAVVDKGRPSNSFEKIMLRLSTMYPNFTRYCTCEMKNNCCFFERLLKVQKNDIFPLGIFFRSLQSLSVKKQLSPFTTLLSGTEGPAGNRHSSNIVLTLLIRLLGADDTWLRQKLKNTASTLFSRDILGSVFYHFSCTVYYDITFIICLIQKL